MLAFSFTVPFTRVAVEGLAPLFIGSGRAVVAAVLAATALALTRQRPPRGAQWGRLAVVAGGVVAGFPLLTSFALTTTPASHGAVVIALLPAATAVVAVLRAAERPPTAFWIATAAGALVAVGFAAVQSGGPARLHWAALGYLGVVSMFLGFFAWYRGLGIGPIARVGQMQLVQPVLSIVWAGLLLGEDVSGATFVGGLGVILCAGLAVRVRLDRTPMGALAAEPSATPDAVPAGRPGGSAPTRPAPGLSGR